MTADIYGLVYGGDGGVHGRVYVYVPPPIHEPDGYRRAGHDDTTYRRVPGSESSLRRPTVDSDTYRRPR